MRRSSRIEQNQKQQPALAPSNKMLRQLRWQLKHEKKLKERKETKLEKLNKDFSAIQKKYRAVYRELDEVSKKFEDEKQRNLMKCPICQEIYTWENGHLPLVSRCGHTLCTTCFTKIYKAADRKPRCPFDRTVIPLTNEWRTLNVDVLLFNSRRGFLTTSLDS